MIALSKNSVFHQKRKHIDTRYHFIMELVSNGEVHLKPCKLSNQMVNIFTKPLEKTCLSCHASCLSLVVIIKVDC